MLFDTSPVALMREISASIGQCQLTHLRREPIDPALAEAQHAAYARLLGRLGHRVTTLPPQDALPDAVFVEDTALVLDEVALICRPGTPARRAETDTVAEVLRGYRPITFVVHPGCLEGGDVLRMGRHIYVGASQRTNPQGIAQLREATGLLGYEMHTVQVSACLHLKSAVTPVSDDTLLINPEWVDPAAFAAYQLIHVAAEEAFAANALLTQAGVIYPAAYPRTLERLFKHGINVYPVDMSELAKAEGGVTCCSLLISPPQNGGASHSR